MAREPSAPNPPADPPVSLDDLGHPRGTLAIVAIFALLFAAGWFAFYFWLYLGRGATHH